jgi:hypothetical protein
LLSSRLPPQLLLAAQSSVERHRSQLVHDSRARLHHAVSVPQQLSQVPIPPVRHPDQGKVIFDHESQNQLRILAIRFLLNTRFVRISAASQIPNPNCNSESSRSNQRAVPSWLAFLYAFSFSGPPVRDRTSPLPPGAAGADVGSLRRKTENLYSPEVF